MQITRHQDCTDIVGFGLANLVCPWFCSCNSHKRGEEDEVDEAKGGGRDKATGTIATSYLT